MDTSSVLRRETLCSVWSFSDYYHRSTVPDNQNEDSQFLQVFYYKSQNISCNKVSQNNNIYMYIQNKKRSNIVSSIGFSFLSCPLSSPFLIVLVASSGGFYVAVSEASPGIDKATFYLRVVVSESISYN
jgi:hypothetical protein